eukprot:COSAG06_NODE_654_length_13350_cov_72.384499_10_plen_1253_part_00
MFSWHVTQSATVFARGNSRGRARRRRATPTAAYRLEIGSDQAAANWTLGQSGAEHTLFDSGWIASSLNEARYAEGHLEFSKRYHWRVQVGLTDLTRTASPCKAFVYTGSVASSTMEDSVMDTGASMANANGNRAARIAKMMQRQSAPRPRLSAEMQAFHADAEHYALCCELLAPGLELPDQSWWDAHCQDLRGHIAAQKCDFGQAFVDDWSLQMDGLLMDYATERAELKGKAFQVAKLTLDELISSDAAPPTPGPATGPDKRALRRGASVIPRYALPPLGELMLAASPKNQLSDFGSEAIRARFLLLLRWNKIVERCIPMLNLQQHCVVRSDHIAHRLCRSKGRLLPDVKANLIKLAIKFTAGSNSQPRINLHVGLPDTKPPGRSVFEQLFEQLYNKHSLRGTESQLWRVNPSGPGVGVYWTDGTDAGGHFRASVSKLCEDLCRGSDVTEGDDDEASAMLVSCPNCTFGDDTLKYVPNPECVQPSHLERFKFLGQLMGASARTGTGFVELDLPSFLWKQLLQETVGVHELSGVDSRMAAMLEIASTTDDAIWTAATLEEPLCWCVRFVDGRVVSLRGDGTEEVEASDRAEYVTKALSKWIEQFSAQIDAIRTGLFAVFPELASRLMTWRELERRVCGHSDVSVAALKVGAQYEGSAREGSEYMNWFWQVLEGFSGDQRKQFLGFVWGRSRLPTEPTQRFTIDLSGDEGSLPRSHTCMFQLHLPRYSSAEILRDRLLLAIQNAGASGARRSVLVRAVSADDHVEPTTERPTFELKSSSVENAKYKHNEDLASFINRIGVSKDEAAMLHAELTATGINTMKGLMAGEFAATTLAKSLTAVLDGTARTVATSSVGVNISHPFALPTLDAASQQDKWPKTYEVVNASMGGSAAGAEIRATSTGTSIVGVIPVGTRVEVDSMKSSWNVSMKNGRRTRTQHTMLHLADGRGWVAEYIKGTSRRVPVMSVVGTATGAQAAAKPHAAPVSAQDFGAGRYRVVGTSADTDADGATIYSTQAANEESKTGGIVPRGEVVTIAEVASHVRDMRDVVTLRLSDGRGWLVETSCAFGRPIIVAPEPGTPNAPAPAPELGSEPEPEPEPEPVAEPLAWAAVTVAEWTQLQQLAAQKYVCPCHDVFFSGPAAAPLGIIWDWVVAPTEEEEGSDDAFGAVRSVAPDSIAAALGVCSGMVLVSASCSGSHLEAPRATHRRAVDLCDSTTARPLRCQFRLLSTSTTARVRFAVAALAEAREMFDSSQDSL